jgi:hypothetical protein
VQGAVGRGVGGGLLDLREDLTAAVGKRTAQLRAAEIETNHAAVLAGGNGEVAPPAEPACFRKQLPGVETDLVGEGTGSGRHGTPQAAVRRFVDRIQELPVRHEVTSK